jgi:hypothetical protein
MTRSLIGLKERIAISDEFSIEERAFLLDAVNATPQVHIAEGMPVDSRNYLGRIDQIWAALSLDDGGEGVCAAPLVPGMLSVPLIAADKQRLSIIKPIARGIATAFQKPVRLAKFSKREDVEIFQP